MSEREKHFNEMIAGRVNYLYRKGKTKAAARDRKSRWIASLTPAERVEIAVMLEEFHSQLMRPTANGLVDGHHGTMYCECRLAEILRSMNGLGDRRERVVGADGNL